jgi:lipopolysaccharide transport system ATP-binding protein
LGEGKIIKEGAPGQVISSYLRSSSSALTKRIWPSPTTSQVNEKVWLHCIRVRPSHGNLSDPITVHTPFIVEFEYWNCDPTSYLSVSFSLYTEHNILLFDIASPFEPDWRQKQSPVGLLRSVCHVPGDFLNNGLHRVALIVLRNHVPVIEEPEALTFDVQDGTIDERGCWFGKWPGAIRTMLKWENNIPISSS